MPNRLLIASVLLGALTTAHAQTPSRLWKRTAALPPGTSLHLYLQDQPHPIDCALVWIDLNALACETYDDRGIAHRVVYPAASIASVKRRRTPDEAEDHRRNLAVVIGMAAGGLLGGLIGANAGTGTGFAAAGIGALIGGGVALNHTMYAPLWPLYP